MFEHTMIMKKNEKRMACLSAWRENRKQRHAHIDHAWRHRTMSERVKRGENLVTSLSVKSRVLFEQLSIEAVLFKFFPLSFDGCSTSHQRQLSQSQCGMQEPDQKFSRGHRIHSKIRSPSRAYPRRPKTQTFHWALIPSLARVLCSFSKFLRRPNGRCR